jgi:hypothetical protein
MRGKSNPGANSLSRLQALTPLTKVARSAAGNAVPKRYAGHIMFRERLMADYDIISAGSGTRERGHAALTRSFVGQDAHSARRPQFPHFVILFACP